MEAQCREVAFLKDALPVDFHTEGMGGIVDDLQSVGVCNLPDALGLTGLAIDVHGHDGGRAGSDGGLDKVGIDVACLRIDVNEDRSDAVPPDGVGGGNEAERGGDDFSRHAQSLQRRDKRQRAVGEKTDIGNFQVLAQRGLQLLVHGAVVGEPLALPYLRNHLVKVRLVGYKRRSDPDWFQLFVRRVLNVHIDNCYFRSLSCKSNKNMEQMLLIRIFFS